MICPLYKLSWNKGCEKEKSVKLILRKNAFMYGYEKNNTQRHSISIIQFKRKGKRKSFFYCYIMYIVYICI